ncbi:MAG: diaminopimelate dehydrogenase [Clostridia bacterium]|nr:diaminopimelate dehydrogenase [Clostridia bacterium]
MKIAIYGYGNLGRGVEAAMRQNPDCELIGVFSRRDPSAVKTRTGIPVYPAADILNYKEQIDVLILCGGSATDLPELTPALAKDFCVVDSFDTHANIPTHFGRVDAAAREGRTLCLISAGWDPGMFSIARVYAQAILPEGQDYTFWGRGVSQGHSDAIRRIPGVLDARQYTVPVPEALDAVGRGENPTLTTRDKHTRECYVVAAEGADKAAIEEAIVTMPNYFADYNTTVTFITAEEMQEHHMGLPHGGRVIRNGVTGLEGEHTHTVSYSLRLDSNPEFTASAILAFARAVYRMKQRGRRGCLTVLDVAPADLSPLSAEELRAHML